MGVARQRLHDDQVLAFFDAHEGFRQHPFQLLQGIKPLVRGKRVFIPAVIGGHLHQVQLLDIPGNGGLGDIVSGLFQLLHQLLLGLNIPVGNDLANFDMPLRLHDPLSSHPPSSPPLPCNFFRTTSKKDRSFHLIKKVTDEERLTRMMSSTSNR